MSEKLIYYFERDGEKGNIKIPVTSARKVAEMVRNGACIVKIYCNRKNLLGVFKDESIIEQATNDKLFITEIINDLYRNGFIADGKADSMLKDWARELRIKSMYKFNSSKLKNHHKNICGSENW